MRILPVSWAALLCFLVSLLFVASFCDGSDTVVEVVGNGECADCAQNNFKTGQAFSGLRVTIDCKVDKGEFKTRGVGELDEDGKFKVSLPKDIVHEDGKLKEECYAQLHSVSATPCPSHDGLESSKIVFKTKNEQKHTFGLAGKLKFSPVTCASAFFRRHFKYPTLPKWPIFPHPKFELPPLKNFGHPIPFPPKYKKPLPPIPKVLPPPVPIYKPKPPVPIYKPKPPVPVYKPPVPVYKPKPPVPVYKPKPPVPIYKPKPPVPVYKPKPPVPVYKPKPPVPVYKPKPPVPIYKPKPPVPVYKPKPPIPVYKPKPPVPKVFPRPVPIYKPKPPVPKVLPPPIPIYKPKTPVYIKPHPPIPKIPPFYKKPWPPLPKLSPVWNIPPKYFHHPKFGKWPHVPPFVSHP